MNAKSGKVIGDINGEEQMYPASMTKIMTTILAIENLEGFESGDYDYKRYGSGSLCAGCNAGWISAE